MKIGEFTLGNKIVFGDDPLAGYEFIITAKSGNKFWKGHFGNVMDGRVDHVYFEDRVKAGDSVNLTEKEDAFLEIQVNRILRDTASNIGAMFPLKVYRSSELADFIHAVIAEINKDKEIPLFD